MFSKSKMKEKIVLNKYDPNIEYGHNCNKLLHN